MRHIRNPPVKVLAVLAAVGILLCGAGAVGRVAFGGSRTVTLEVVGSGAAHVTWRVGGDVEQDLAAVLPWRRHITADEPVSVAAQLLGVGEIACRAGARQRQASGEYAYVACTAT